MGTWTIWGGGGEESELFERDVYGVQDTQIKSWALSFGGVSGEPAQVLNKLCYPASSSADCLFPMHSFNNS